MGFVNLTDHKIGDLQVFFKELRAQFRGIEGQKVNITSLHGYIYYDTSNKIQNADVTIDQPFGSYCVVANYIEDKSDSSCDYYKDNP